MNPFSSGPTPQWIAPGAHCSQLTVSTGLASPENRRQYPKRVAVRVAAAPPVVSQCDFWRGQPTLSALPVSGFRIQPRWVSLTPWDCPFCD